MSEIQRAEIVRLPGDRATVTGTVGEVGHMVARMEAAGRLVSATMPVPTGVPGQVLVNVRLIPRQRPVSRPAAPARRRLPKWARTAIAAGVVSALAVAGWLVVTVVRLVVENAALLLGVLALAAGGFALVARAGRGRTFSGTFQGGMD